MAGIIAVDNETTWKVSNWVYWNLMDQVLSALRGEPPLAHFVEMCKWNHGLNIPMMQQDEPETASRVLGALETAALRCSQGSVLAAVDDRILDDESQQRFREATQRLVTILSGLR